MSRVVRGGFPDRQFDVDFWQAQGDEPIFEAAFDMLQISDEFKGVIVEQKPRLKEFLRQLNKHHVKFLVVGDLAIIKYTEPFHMSHLEIWVEGTPENAERTYSALVDFGAPMADLTVSEFTQPNTVYQFGVVPIRVDVMTTIDAVTFHEAWADRVETHLGDIALSIISLAHLKKNKEASIRDTDKIHLDRLEKYAKRSKQ